MRKCHRIPLKEYWLLCLHEARCNYRFLHITFCFTEPLSACKQGTLLPSGRIIGVEVCKQLHFWAGTSRGKRKNKSKLIRITNNVVLSQTSLNLPRFLSSSLSSTSLLLFHFSLSLSFKVIRREISNQLQTAQCQSN